MKNSHLNYSYFLGIDIGKRVHFATLTDKHGKEIDSFKFKNTKAGFTSLLKHLDKWVNDKARKCLLIGFEATGHYWLPLYQFLSSLGLKIVLLNPLQTKSFRNTGIRGTKTDKVDGKLIADIIRFSSFDTLTFFPQKPDEKVLALKRLTRFRSGLVNRIGNTKKRVVSILDLLFPEFEKVFSNIFSKTSMAILEKHVLAYNSKNGLEGLKEIKTKALANLIEKASKKRLKGDKAIEKAAKVKKAAENTIGFTIGLDAFFLELRLLIEQLKHLESQVEKVDKMIKELFLSFETSLTTIPGISETTGAVILAEIGNILRFEKAKNPAKALTAFAGIDPKLKESGKSKGQTVMSKRGSKHLRTALFQASLVASVWDPMFKSVYKKHKDKGKHHHVALSHVARKMTHVIYSLLKSNKTYKPVLAN